MLVRTLFVWLLVSLFGFPAAINLALAAETEPSVEGLISFSMPKFPPQLRGIVTGDGEVVIAITIDLEGNVNDSMVLQATNEEFSESASLAVKYWKFSPASSDIWPRREVLQFDFKRSGVVTTLSHEEAAREGFAGTQTPQIKTMQWDELDSEPERLAARMPKVSKAAIDKHGDQPLMINFVIDTKGQVRVPVIFGTDDSELAETVLEAVRTWLYAPPMHNKKPVAVEVTRALVLTDTTS